MKIVAEIGLGHESSLGMALAYVDACAKAGAWACKFQDHRGDKVNQFRSGTSFPQDATRADFWNRTAFTNRQWQMIRHHCHDRGVKFGVSVFSTEAIYQLGAAGVVPDFWKLGSGVSCNPMLIGMLNVPSCEVVASFGMSTISEVEQAIAIYHPSRTTILDCVSEYPCPPEHCRFSSIQDPYLRAVGFKTGISDHSGTIFPSLIAAWMGADMTEVHVCWSRECFGPDVPASITIDELRQLVQGVRFVEKMRANPVDKDKMASELSEMRGIFCVPH